MTPAGTQNDLSILKALGRAHINANRLDQALDVFAEILVTYPEDIETLIILGDCYLAANQSSMAAHFYRKAQQLAPENSDVDARVQLIEEEIDLNSIAIDLRDENSMDALFVQLTGKGKAISTNELERAAELLALITESEHPALAVSEHLDDIENLLPALLQLNIQQARSDGQSDLARDLENLLETFYSQQEEQRDLPTWKDNELPAVPGQASETGTRMSVALLNDRDEDDCQRIIMAIKALQDLGCPVTTISDPQSVASFQGQAALVHNPHTSALKMQLMAQAAALNIPILLDLDVSLQELKESIGLLEPGQMASGVRKFLTSALNMADTVVVQSPVVFDLLRIHEYQTELIPYTWDRSNTVWSTSAPERDTINIGWLGSATELDAIASIRRPLLRVLREFPHTHLVIGGSTDAYQLFDSIPESRRTYLPDVQEDDDPFSLRQIDILLDPAPPGERAKVHSDRRLVEAGIRSIPWIATPSPAARAWGAGGQLADDVDNWHTALYELVTEPNHRKTFGQEGFLHAKRREICKLAPRWLKAFAVAVRLGAQA